MKKNTIKLNEGQLKQIVAESVKKVLKEEFSKGTLEYDFEDRIRKRFARAIDEAAYNMVRDFALDDSDMEQMVEQAIQNVWLDSLKRGCFNRLPFSEDL